MTRLARHLVLLVALLPANALAQQFKSRVMVILDTSGSMGFYFDDPQIFGPPPNVDYPGGDGSTSYTDTKVANVFAYPGKAVGGQCTLQTLNRCDGQNSRLFAAKQALNNALNAHAGNIDFGLEVFDFQLCPFNNPLCTQCDIGPNGYTCLYTNNQFTKLDKVNWISQACLGPGRGGRILVPPGADSANKIFPWIDGVENHRDSGDGNNSFGTTGTPVNPEIRAMGNTPIAESLLLAKTDWYDKVRAGDPFIDCRPYAVVVATDGEQSVNGGCGADPVNAARALYGANAKNPVLTYVIGIGINAQSLNAIAQAGGTGQARFAANKAATATAFADIAAASVRYEVCDNRDNDCDGQVDEGFDRNAKCSVGVGQCLRNGIKKCLQDGSGTQCCVDDGNPNTPCVALLPGASRKEFCNSLDDDCNGIVDDPPACGVCKPVVETCNDKDDDCDGVIDNMPADADQPCGLNLGRCKPGRTSCFAGKLQCLGATGPAAETCNNVDDDCDGIVDGLFRACYSGPMGTDGQGVCRGGQQKCSAGAWAACQGEALPQAEICNGVDDNCNGKIDDAPGTGTSCCPSGMCGTGACKAGTLQCSGGTVQCLGGQGPSGEICDAADNDCNGKVDDLPGIGRPCTPQGGCGGMLACDLMKQQVTCQPVGMMGKEICNGTDDDCDGLVDEKDADIINDPKIGQPCGNPMNQPPPCLAGKTACKNAMYICVGAVGPQMEVCDGQDNDCDGKPDNAAPCPANFVCYNGTCDPLCGPGEFPCPGGFTTVIVDGKCVCAPEQLCNPPCQAPLFCRAGKCVDRCDGVMCKAPLKCADGACYGCEKFGCPDQCTRCEPATHECVPDKCCNVKCDAGKFCDPRTGMCVGTCNPPCGQGQQCKDGKCVDNPCAKVECKSGEVCDPETGMCRANKCAFITCGANLACCQEECRADPCVATNCPEGSVCRVDQLTCKPDCVTKPALEKQEIVTAGGAFSCAVGRRDRALDSRLAALALALLLGLAARRRRL